MVKKGSRAVEPLMAVRSLRLTYGKKALPREVAQRRWRRWRASGRFPSAMERFWRRFAGAAEARALRNLLEEGGEASQAAAGLLEVFCGLRGRKSARAFCVDDPRCAECPLQARCAYHARSPRIKALPPESRPREKLLGFGEERLDDAELLAIVLRGGSPKESAVDLARRLLRKFRGLSGLAEAGPRELQEVVGVGPAKAAQVKAALELARRFAGEQPRLGRVISSSEDVYELYVLRFHGLKKERFVGLLLDNAHRVAQEVSISEGTLGASLVHPREVFKQAIRESAAALILLHNHPSGDPTPSEEDRDITARLSKVAELVGIRLLDHVIICDGGYYSFSEEGILRSP